jgi:hypothetical protein
MSSLATSAPTRGQVYFWSKLAVPCPDSQRDTNVTTLVEGSITGTPLRFDLTHAVLLEQMNRWQWWL